MPPPVALIDWPLTPYTGWGNYGIQLTQALLEQGSFAPLPTCENLHTSFCDPLWLAHLRQLEQQSAPIREQLKALPQGHQLSTSADICLTALGNGIALPRFQARRQVGVTFFERTHFAPAELERLKAYNLVVAGSRWNAQLLSTSAPCPVALVHQGVDFSRFNPAPVPRLLNRSLVVFSGGKLEARKGQDIVIAAFRKLLVTHPDALLMVAWGNVGGVAQQTIGAAPHVDGVPECGDSSTKALADWLNANGIPMANLVVLPNVVNLQLPSLIKQADIAVFVSRCEGGTNLMAMETLACGIPTVLSANTGHLDLLDGSIPHAIPVGMDGIGNVSPQLTAAYGGDPVGMWGETDPDELLRVWLRLAAGDRQNLRISCFDGIHSMAHWSWKSSMERLMNVLHAQ